MWLYLVFDCLRFRASSDAFVTEVRGSRHVKFARGFRVPELAAAYTNSVPFILLRYAVFSPPQAGLALTSGYPVKTP